MRRNKNCIDRIGFDGVCGTVRECSGPKERAAWQVTRACVCITGPAHSRNIVKLSVRAAGGMTAAFVFRSLQALITLYLSGLIIGPIRPKERDKERGRERWRGERKRAMHLYIIDRPLQNNPQSIGSAEAWCGSDVSLSSRPSMHSADYRDFSVLCFG